MKKLFFALSLMLISVCTFAQSGWLGTISIVATAQDSAGLGIKYKWYSPQYPTFVATDIYIQDSVTVSSDITHAGIVECFDVNCTDWCQNSKQPIGSDWVYGFQTNINYTNWNGFHQNEIFIPYNKFSAIGGRGAIANGKTQKIKMQVTNNTGFFKGMNQFIAVGNAVFTVTVPDKSPVYPCSASGTKVSTGTTTSPKKK